MKKIGAGFLIVTVLVALSGAFSAFYTVDAGDRAVVLRNGAVHAVTEPGLHFKMPFIDSASDISVRSNAVRYEDIPSYSRDQQAATITLSINYHLRADKIAAIYSQYNGEQGVIDRIIYPKMQEQLKNVFGQYNAVTAIQERPRLNADVFQAIVNSAIGPVIIEGVQIENIDFSDIYEKSVEDRMLAEVEVAKLRQNAEREKVQAEIAVTQAQAKADSQKALADAEAYTTQVNGLAEAGAIKARGEALRDNPGVIQLTAVERWSGAVPQAMIPGSAVPFIDMNGMLNK